MKLHIVKSATEIITTTLGMPEDYKQRCVQEIYKIGDKQGQKTNVKAIMSSYWIWKETDVFNPLLDKIKEKVYVAFPILDSRFKYGLQDCWGAVYKNGHYTVSHSHIPSHISFVYYLKSNIGSSPLNFDGCDFNIQPYDDLLIIFPSYLLHSVPKHKGEDRVCIAGNMSMVLK